MLLIHCPWCGPRAESEFNCGGEGGIARPPNTEALTDEQWGDYVFMRKNPQGRAPRAMAPHAAAAAAGSMRCATR